MDYMTLKEDEDDTVVAIYYSADDVPYGYMVYLISSDIMHIKESRTMQLR